MTEHNNFEQTIRKCYWMENGYCKHESNISNRCKLDDFAQNYWRLPICLHEKIIEVTVYDSSKQTTIGTQTP